VIAVMALLVAVGGTQQTGANKQIADAVIAMTKAQWAAENQKDTATAMKDLADDYTEFNSGYSARVEGKAMATRLAEAGTKASSSGTVASEMGNPKVQVYNDDVAILSYNYMGITKDKDGKTEPARAKSTRVYVKQNGAWKLVHANFGADPVPK
jgi:hypothetical protein